MEKLEFIHILFVKVYIYINLMENGLIPPLILNLCISYDPEILSPFVFNTNVSLYEHKIFIRMFIMLLFIIALTLKQLTSINS